MDARWLWGFLFFTILHFPDYTESLSVLSPFSFSLLVSPLKAPIRFTRPLTSLMTLNALTTANTGLAIAFKKSLKHVKPQSFYKYINVAGHPTLGNFNLDKLRQDYYAQKSDPGLGINFNIELTHPLIDKAKEIKRKFHKPKRIKFRPLDSYPLWVQQQIKPNSQSWTGLGVGLEKEKGVHTIEATFIPKPTKNVQASIEIVAQQNRPAHNFNVKGTPHIPTDIVLPEAERLLPEAIHNIENFNPRENRPQNIQDILHQRPPNFHHQGPLEPIDAYHELHPHVTKLRAPIPLIPIAEEVHIHDPDKHEVDFKEIPQNIRLPPFQFPHQYLPTPPRQQLLLGQIPHGVKNQDQPKHEKYLMPVLNVLNNKESFIKALPWRQTEAYTHEHVVFVPDRPERDTFRLTGMNPDLPTGESIRNSEVLQPNQQLPRTVGPSSSSIVIQNPREIAIYPTPRPGYSPVITEYGGFRPVYSPLISEERPRPQVLTGGRKDKVYHATAAQIANVRHTETLPKEKYFDAVRGNISSYKHAILIPVKNYQEQMEESKKLLNFTLFRPVKIKSTNSGRIPIRNIELDAHSPTLKSLSWSNRTNSVKLTAVEPSKFSRDQLQSMGKEQNVAFNSKEFPIFETKPKVEKIRAPSYDLNSKNENVHLKNNVKLTHSISVTNNTTAPTNLTYIEWLKNYYPDYYRKYFHNGRTEGASKTKDDKNPYLDWLNKYFPNWRNESFSNRNVSYTDWLLKYYPVYYQKHYGSRKDNFQQTQSQPGPIINSPNNGPVASASSSEVSYESPISDQHQDIYHRANKPADWTVDVSVKKPNTNNPLYPFNHRDPFSSMLFGDMDSRFRQTPSHTSTLSVNEYLANRKEYLTDRLRHLGGKSLEIEISRETPDDKAVQSVINYADYVLNTKSRECVSSFVCHVDNLIYQQVLKRRQMAEYQRKGQPNEETTWKIHQRIRSHLVGRQVQAINCNDPSRTGPESCRRMSTEEEVMAKLIEVAFPV